ncbi:hypothetical protein [Mycobacterium sp. Lab-001]|uniref:hypothetical protein n=1 Tax=Mycobacterium sp. Lab-001 TaxID=3410136 RepID=UPI003D17FC3F
MDTTPSRPGSDEGFAFLDFGDQSVLDGGDSSDFGDGYAADDRAVLDFGDQSGPGSADPPDIDALVGAESSASADTGSAPGLADALPRDAGDTDTADAGEEDDDEPLATVTNPSGTVSVTARMDGSIQVVKLSPEVASMTESGLAEEIFVIADLAQQQALSIQRTFVFESFHALGADDDEALAEMLGEGVTELPSPEAAARAQAEVFATRYVSDDR